MKLNLPLPFAITLFSLAVLSCKASRPLPKKDIAAKIIQEKIVEDGQMPGGNVINIHKFEIKKIEPSFDPNTARIDFQIDFTRQPTSGLAPEYQTGSPTRQTEDHYAVLKLEKDQWLIRDLTFH